ncbi:MAG: type II toxin-antitoxin system prevent-host-death family antitoxin [Deinococcus sp.]|nr:type II toxin-antitoxin system prevent-host-death family antitoxin [Deinococcus sp.]
MRREISAEKARVELGAVLEAVKFKGEHFIISRRGQPMAALVPVHVAEHYEESRRALVEMIEEVWERNRDKDPAGIEAAIDRAISEVRAERRARRAKLRQK